MHEPLTEQSLARAGDSIIHLLDEAGLPLVFDQLHISCVDPCYPAQVSFPTLELDHIRGRYKTVDVDVSYTPEHVQVAPSGWQQLLVRHAGDGLFERIRAGDVHDALSDGVLQLAAGTDGNNQPALVMGIPGDSYAFLKPKRADPARRLAHSFPEHADFLGTQYLQGGGFAFGDPTAAPASLANTVLYAIVQRASEAKHLRVYVHSHPDCGQFAYSVGRGFPLLESLREGLDPEGQSFTSSRYHAMELAFKTQAQSDLFSTLNSAFGNGVLFIPELPIHAHRTPGICGVTAYCPEVQGR
ncbi:hypothetical protein COY28_05715 [Candidatus Woesearchaeota archaeon CG_4_10_14_0_2_um_filter_57_5]|nr:MAG: hypothetical protein AUJ68_04995 [Candidatus Woesearchaeota archaeon CG1_02_57_44]PIN68731.1 MAG: hypothetical protein COV94_03765 [Candidatus Woesearchaeota archaeon CG11_big_fil_rev_8_21_14_0_20_57_5]PIZ50146.1 MAG: hypothetical protein COY28_05715 [Candidatus Woesearchaeota archaeon CG_4_10_14_0_2_um_filter_57_5]